jgi:hypothetical protein
VSMLNAECQSSEIFGIWHSTFVIDSAFTSLRPGAWLISCDVDSSQRQEIYSSGLDRPIWSDLSYGRFLAAGEACAGPAKHENARLVRQHLTGHRTWSGQTLSTARALDVSDVCHFTDRTRSAQLEDGVESCVGCWSSSR